MSRSCGTLLVVSLALLSTGCVGVTTSQVRWKPPTSVERTEFDSAMTYADQAKSRYQEALGNQAALSRNLGASLIAFARRPAGWR